MIQASFPARLVLKLSELNVHEAFEVRSPEGSLKFQLLDMEVFLTPTRHINILKKNRRVQSQRKFGLGVELHKFHENKIYLG